MAKTVEAPNPYEQFVEEVEEIDPQKLLSIAQLAKQIEEEEQGMARLLAEMEEAKKRHTKLTTIDLPDVMEACNMETFVTNDGLAVKVEKKTRTSLPAARIEAGCDWLEEHDSGAIVKRVVSIAFNKEDEDKAKMMTEILGNTFPETQQKRSVHPSTLNSHIRQMIEQGMDVDLDLFGVFEQRVAKIGRKKKK